MTHNTICEESKTTVYRDKSGKLYGARTYRRVGNTGCYAEMWELNEAGTQFQKRLFTDKERNLEKANAVIQRAVQQRGLSFVE